MPYYTGAANSMAGLLESVTAACVAEGWTWADSILSKGNVFVQLTANDSGNPSPSIQIRGGTGRADGALVNPSTAYPYLARPTDNINIDNISYPVTYHLFVFEDPAEVYLVVQYGVDWHAWLAFGESVINGVSIWIAASRASVLYFDGSGRISIGINGITNISSNVYATGAFFWKVGMSNYAGALTYNIDINNAGAWMPTSLPNAAYPVGMVSATPSAMELIDQGLSTWNNESILIPIQPHLRVDGNKIQMLADIQNARYIRVDNYDSGQILTIGSEQWMVFPFIRKNTGARDGGTRINHTGTFGWAIRYDGNS